MSGNKLLHHPKGLYFLFFTEMWEKFSYFGMRSLLVYYMIKHMLFEQAYASSIYGLFTGLVYFTPIIGGILGDRFIGRQRAIILGIVLMLIGHFFMMIESLLYPALLFLILGSGIFGPNIAPQVADLYKKDDRKSSHAFSIVYLGVNVGAMLAPLVCGTLGEVYGWQYGFGAAGMGMIIGLIIYLAGRKYLPCDQLSSKNFSNCTAASKKDLICTTSEPHRVKRAKMLGFLVLILFGILFRMVYNQQGNTLAVWIDSYVDRWIYGWEIPGSWFQALNPFMVIILTPFLMKLWNWQAKYNREPSSINKMAIGCFIMSISFLLLVPVASSSHVSIFWPMFSILVLSVGELYFCPIALAFITKNASRTVAALAVAIWQQSYFAGNMLSGLLGRLLEILPKGLFFFILFFIVFIAGIGIARLSKVLKRQSILT